MTMTLKENSQKINPRLNNLSIESGLNDNEYEYQYSIEHLQFLMIHYQSLIGRKI